jgi:hypothetical protein
MPPPHITLININIDAVKTLILHMAFWSVTQQQRSRRIGVVALGWPLLYGSALGGAQGVQSVCEHLRNELIMTMQLAGTPAIKSIAADCAEGTQSGSDSGANTASANTASA